MESGAERDEFVVRPGARQKRGERGDVARREENARNAVFDDVVIAGTVGGDDGTTLNVRLQKQKRKSFPTTRRDDHGAECECENHAQPSR